MHSYKIKTLSLEAEERMFGAGPKCGCTYQEHGGQVHQNCMTHRLTTRTNKKHPGTGAKNTIHYIGQVTCWLKSIKSEITLGPFETIRW
jgi:hypothetical protein